MQDKVLRSDKAYVQNELLATGQKPVMSSDVFKVENGLVLAKDLRANMRKYNIKIRI